MTPIRSIGELRALRKRLVGLRNIGAVVAPRVAARFSAIARADFDARRGPSGKPWKPNKNGKVPTLRRTGELESAATAFRAFGSSIRASVLGIRYARYQNPGRFMPSSKKLSPERAAVVEQIAEQEIRRAVGGGS